MATKFWTVLEWLKANLIWSVPAAMLLGLGFGLVADPSFLKAAVLPLTFLMVYPMMINLQIRSVLSGHDYKLQLTALLINFLVVPLLAFGLGRFLLADRVFVALGLLLMATLPTSGMTISWTGFARGNLDAAANSEPTATGAISSRAFPSFPRSACWVSSLPRSRCKQRRSSGTPSIWC